MYVRDVEGGKEGGRRRLKVVIRWSGEAWEHEALLQEDGSGP